MGMLKLIEWKDETRDTIVHKIDMKRDYITRGSKITVRESQAAVFCDKGRMADVFLPGFYTLDTDNVPLLTKLMSWKYGFESPFKSDVYFVNTKQFTDMKWGTKNPIIIRDADYGAVRVRAFGTYSFKVSDPYIFMSELSGTNSSFSTHDITEWIRSMIVTHTSDIIGESKIPILDMAGNLVELGEMLEVKLTEKLKGIGIEIPTFNFENFSMPEALEKALDENTALGMKRRNMDVIMMQAQADALKEAAKNPGMAGTMMGAGLGMGMGVNMGAMFGNMYANGMQQQQQQMMGGFKCPGCGKQLADGTKFCPECGQKIVTACPKCGKKVEPGTKFCPDCGGKLS